MGYPDVSGLVGTLEVKKPKILFLITEDWYFWSHRLPLARSVRDAGYDVVIATRVDKYKTLIQNEGFKLIPIMLRRSSKNPLRELLTLFQLIRIYLKERPDLVHHVALKPLLYGSWAARFVGVPAVVNAFAGLGVVFVAQGRKASIFRKCISIAYKMAFSLKNAKVIFQNPDDSTSFLDKGLVAAKDIVVIKGSGVETSDFKPIPESIGPPLVMQASRMLWDKGVAEFVKAAEMLRAEGTQARFALVGDTDLENPAAVPRIQLEAWKKSDIVEWWGWKDHMPTVLGQSHIFCLPSFYGEGIPKVLIEAAACGRAIVTTDSPGCREVVRHGDNGLLVPVRDSKALANAIRTLIENPDLRTQMGARGRKIAVTEFSVEKIIEETLIVYRALLKNI